MGATRAALLAALVSSFGAIRADSAPLTAGNLVVLDALADPFALGGFGAAFEVDRASPPASNSRAVGSSTAFARCESVATETSGSVLIIDSEADPSGLGADANGGLGPGALFRVDPDLVSVTLLADGQNYRGGLPPPLTTIFVDPTGLAVDAAGRALVVDPDADPSGFGPDPLGFAGYGALFRVDAVSGEVELMADGSRYPAGLPLGEPSVFVDPVAVALAPDGSAVVLDIGADPLALGAQASLFRVELATGVVTLISSDPAFRAAFDLSVEPTGQILVSDWSADPLARGDRGALFRVDPAGTDPGANATVLVASSLTRSLAGVEATGSGHVFLTDSLADGLGLGRSGTVWEVEPATGALGVASSTPAYLSMIDVAGVRSAAPAPVPSSLSPGFANQGDALTVTITGSGFQAPATVRLGAGISVLAARVDSASRISADIQIALDAEAGTRDLVVGNPDLQGAALTDAFEVRGKPAPVVSSITPSAAAQGDAIAVVVRGQFFDAGATLGLGAGMTISNLVVVDATELRGDLQVDAAAPVGPHDVVVTNGDLRTGSLVAGFTVTPPRAPVVTGVSPASAAPGALVLTLSGSDFRPGASVDLGAGLHVSQVVWVSQSRLEVQAAAPFDAPPGARDVAVTNPDLQSGLLPSGFTLEGSSRLVPVSLRPDEVAGGNGDGRLDPGETVDLVLRIANRGNVGATGIGARLRLTAPVPGVSVAVPFVSFPDAAAGAVVARPGPPQLQIALAAGLACGTLLPLEIELSDVSGRKRVTPHTLVVGHPSTVLLKPELQGSAGDRLGGALAAAGDIDGDGAEDFLVGSPLDDPAGLTNGGRVLVVSGWDGGLLHRFAGGAAGERLGSALAGAADVDGDGVGDVAIGVPGAPPGGAVRLFSGATAATLPAPPPGAAGDELGSAVALGDFDGDGHVDLAIGRPGASVVELWSPLAGRSFASFSGGSGDRFGQALAAVDLDGDGLDEIVIGAPAAGLGGGQVEAHSLARGLILARAGAAAEALGTSVAAAGDLDQDGVGDLVVGAPGHDPGGLGGAGRAMVISVRTGAVLALAVGSEAGAGLGTRVAGGRDADLDGVPDFAWSAPGTGGGGADAAGRVALVSGLSGLVLLAHDGLLARERAGAGGLALLDRDGNGTLDLVVASPLAAPGLQLEAGAAYALAPGLGCTSWKVCTDDASEDNDTWTAAAAVAPGTLAGLAICPGDEDWFRFDVPAGAERVFSIAFDPAGADLDLYAFDSLASLVAVSAGSASPESVKVAAGSTTAETFRMRVIGASGSAGAYALTLRDAASCDVTATVSRLHAAKAVGGAVRLAWTPSADLCHQADPSGVGYRVWAASRARPLVAPSFPTDPPFSDVTTTDGDGSTSDPGFVGPAPGPQLTLFVVTDVGTSGSSGPSASY